MAMLFRRLGAIPLPDVDLLGTAIREVIVETLERSVLFPVVGSTPDGRRLGATSGYAALAKRIAAAKSGSVALITFNYDIALDVALALAGSPADYGLHETDYAPKLIPLLKLHGSVGWARCKTCGGVTTLGLDRIVQRYQPPIRGDFATLPTAESALKDECREGHPREILIVPPTWDKGRHYDTISTVWRRAARHLSQASRIVIAGYSLPDSDQFFRYLYALGTMGPTRLKRILVIDKDLSVGERFRTVLGPLAKSRFVFHQGTFESNTDVIAEQLVVRSE